MEKSPDAFRTISEVAEHLAIPAHVLRFWESRFPQVRPVKRAGGRRYYRPADVSLLVGIKRLLHDEGMTIRGVQKILREQGVRVVSGVPDMPMTEDGFVEGALGDGAMADGMAPHIAEVEDADGIFAADAEPARSDFSPAEVIILQTALDLRSLEAGTMTGERTHATPDAGTDPAFDPRHEGTTVVRPSPLPSEAGLAAADHDTPPAHVIHPETPHDTPQDAFAAAGDAAHRPDLALDGPRPVQTGDWPEATDPPARIEATPAARLRALHAAALPLPLAPLELLATRLAVLRARMSAAARPHRR